MNNITIDEVKAILKRSIDETTNMNEAIERTLQYIYLKGWNDSEKEHNFHLKKLRAEIEAEITPNLSDEQTQAFAYVLQIIDKYKRGKE